MAALQAHGPDARQHAFGQHIRIRLGQGAFFQDHGTNGACGAGHNSVLFGIPTGARLCGDEISKVSLDFISRQDSGKKDLGIGLGIVEQRDGNEVSLGE